MPYHNATDFYYMCSSRAKHRGLGCGAGVYVRQQEVEDEVIAGMRKMLQACADPRGFTRLVNEEARKLWEQASRYDPLTAQKIDAIDRKIANIRQAIVDGLDDIIRIA